MALVTVITISEHNTSSINYGKDKTLYFVADKKESLS